MVRYLPGTLTALVSSVLVGGLLLVISGEWSWEGFFVCFGLSFPLTAFGALYDQLVRWRWLRPGGRNIILYWIVFFPLARIIYIFLFQGRFLPTSEKVASLLWGFGSMINIFGFFIWQFLLGLAYGFGFFILYHQVRDLLMRGFLNSDVYKGARMRS